MLRYTRRPKRLGRYKRFSAVAVPRPIAANEVRFVVEKIFELVEDAAGNCWATMWSGFINASAGNNATYFDQPEY